MQNKITQGVIWKQLLLFFLSGLVRDLFPAVYNTADAVIVGNFRQGRAGRGGLRRWY